MSSREGILCLACELGGAVVRWRTHPGSVASQAGSPISVLTHRRRNSPSTAPGSFFTRPQGGHCSQGATTKRGSKRACLPLQRLVLSTSLAMMSMLVRPSPKTTQVRQNLTKDEMAAHEKTRSLEKQRKIVQGPMESRPVQGPAPPRGLNGFRSGGAPRMGPPKQDRHFS